MNATVPWQPPKLRDTDVTFGSIPGPFNNLPPMNTILSAINDTSLSKYRLFVDNFYMGIAKDFKIEACCDTSDLVRWMHALSASHAIEYKVRATGIALRLREVNAAITWFRNARLHTT